MPSSFGGVNLAISQELSPPKTHLKPAATHLLFGVHADAQKQREHTEGNKQDEQRGLVDRLWQANKDAVSSPNLSTDFAGQTALLTDTPSCTPRRKPSKVLQHSTCFGPPPPHQRPHKPLTVG